MISPQTAKLTTSPKHRAEVEFDVMLADVPVDIYFLMDLSNSMEKHQKNLVDSTSAISQRVMDLTTDAKFGFGSFSDKPTPPFSKPLHKYLEGVVPYSFEHKVNSKLFLFC